MNDHDFYRNNNEELEMAFKNKRLELRLEL